MGGTEESAPGPGIPCPAPSAQRDPLQASQASWAFPRFRHPWGLPFLPWLLCTPVTEGIAALCQRWGPARKAGPAQVASASLGLRFRVSEEEADAGPREHPHPQRKEEAGLEPRLQPRVLGEGRGWKAWRRGLGVPRCGWGWVAILGLGWGDRPAPAPVPLTSSSSAVCSLHGRPTSSGALLPA